MPRARLQRQAQQFDAAGVRRTADPQLAGVEVFARPDIEARHVVSVVAHENERSPARLIPVVDMKVDGERRITAKREHNGPRKRDPLRMPLALLFFALAHDGRVKAQARIVEERAPIDLADIDTGDLSTENFGAPCSD